MTHVLSHLLDVPSWVVLVVAFSLPALEASVFLGLVVPGEIALILGGVAASVGHAPLEWVIAAGILGAIVGDSIGYAVGERWGNRILASTIGRKLPEEKLDAARAFIAARGRSAVFLGRYTAVLRAFVPGLVGMARVPYRIFLPYNVAGGAIWATAAVLLGYIAGASWEYAAHLASIVGFAVLGLVGAAIGYAWWRHRRAAG